MSDFDLRLKFKTLVSAKEKVTHCRQNLESEAPAVVRCTEINSAVSGRKKEREMPTLKVATARCFGSGSDFILWSVPENSGLWHSL